VLPTTGAYQMNSSLSLSTVLRRTFGIYAKQAPVLLTAAIVVDGVVLLDRVQFKAAPALGIIAVLLNLVVIGLFVSLVVLVVGDVYDGGARRGARELLAGALGPLLLVGLLAGLAITLLSAIASTILYLFIIAAVALSAGVGLLGLIVGLLLIPVLVLVPELFLITIWSPVAAVTVLERPGGLRAFRRSRELVRGNGPRVLALILLLAFPLALATGEIERVTRTTGSAPATAISLLVTTLIAPLPALAAAVLYFELRRAKQTPAPTDPTPTGVLPPSVTVS
jgi:hypothetical protein